MAKSLKLAWIPRHSSEKGNFKYAWKASQNLFYLLDKIGGLNLLLRFFYKKIGLKKVYILSKIF